MALDSTSKEQNVKDSVKKYLVDNIYTGEGIELTFDEELTTPLIQERAIGSWVSVLFGNLELGALAKTEVYLYLCTKMDPEGYNLSVLRDKVVGYLVDNTMTDSFARITLYQSDTWTEVGKMVVQVGEETRLPDAQDGTKVTLVPITLFWGAK